MQELLQYSLREVGGSAEMGARTAMQELLQDALQAVGGPAKMGSRLGITTSAVKRWMERGEAPWQYTGDFLRILNRPSMVDLTGDPVRDRDQFYTRRDVAKHCVNTFKQVARHIGVDLHTKHWVEPAAGCGWFYLEFPPERRTGIDIEPKGEASLYLEQNDFLLWQPTAEVQQEYVVLGNPPFGLRGHLALQFINHAATFADMVGFIVPQLFSSDGKGVPGKRISKRLKLAHSEPLPANSFESPNGATVDVSTVFQVWTALNHDRVTLAPPKTCNQWAKVYSLSDGGTPASTRNKGMIDKCDVYLPSTCFEGMKAYKHFNDLPHRRGYGLVIHKDRRDIMRLMFDHDWQKTAFPSTNGALNLRSSLILQPIIEAGYHD